MIDELPPSPHAACRQCFGDIGEVLSVTTAWKSTRDVSTCHCAVPFDHYVKKVTAHFCWREHDTFILIPFCWFLYFSPFTCVVVCFSSVLSKLNVCCRWSRLLRMCGVVCWLRRLIFYSYFENGRLSYNDMYVKYASSSFFWLYYRPT